MIQDLTPTMLSEVVDDYVAEDNPVRVTDAYVDQVDMVAHDFSFSICPKIGWPPYDLRTMLKLIIKIVMFARVR
jgi:transposase